MRDLVLDLIGFGGLARTPTLRALGHSPYRMSMAVRSGAARRPRIGWLALPDADPLAVRAVQLGGRLASANALQSRGIWVDRVVGLTVHVPSTAARLPALRRGETRVRRTLRFDDGGDSWRVSVADAVIQFAHQSTPREWLAPVDSALHAGQLSLAELGALTKYVPHAHRRVALLVDAGAASGNESYARLLLTEAGFRVESQRTIPLVGRVDLLVDGWLIVEADSHEFHDSDADRERDATRDGNAALVGCATLRFRPEALRDRPDWCLDVVRARMRDGRPHARTGSVGATLRVTP